LDSAYPWLAVIDNEAIYITGGGGSTELSVERGVFNTVKAAHSAGATVAPVDISSQGGTPSLVDVLTSGNNTGENEIVGPSGKISMTADSGSAGFYGAVGSGANPGTPAFLLGGFDANGGNGAAVTANGADGSGGHGKLQLESSNSLGAAGEVLTSDGTYATWQTAFAALLAGLPTVDPAVAGQAWNNGGVLMVSAG
jgi:hypothetical protein